ncbi:MAG: bifunctional shikimate kinase/3-dehydroquinate synthase [Rickettsiaceae bacterium]|jgi:shikimate kinase/3-dehydroquinate synthase|nr:bifunctional shikimate kinase/3-dehydroquinate synthase [Rickettsiaceae bacterium]
MDFSLNLQDKKMIVLTGMMGAGKTVIGSKLASKLGFYFIDSDQEIEDLKQQSISDIFKDKGEKYFREIEKQVVKDVLNRGENIVLSLGGGAFMDEEIRNLIKRNAVSVWLYADLDVLLHRISAKNTRPLLNNMDKRAVLSELMIKRYPTYKEADIHIDTSHDSYEAVIKNLMKKIGEISPKEQIKKEVITLNLQDKSYDILVGSGVISEIAGQISRIKSYSKIIVLTDSNVAGLHLHALNDELKKLPIESKNIIVEAGEKSKSFSNLQTVLEQILEIGIDRKSLLIAFGGGVVGDLCGFAASILLRGVDFIQVPTTLLSAVDSSVGGKTAINSKSGKNLIGSFYQPKLVLCDLNFLDTLPERDFVCGYAEAVKYGFIRDKNFFNYLEENLDKIKKRDKEVLQKIIVRSCQIKAEIVGADERENDVRAILNFGHTFGHVFETETGYSNELFHGEAVAIGMVLASKMSAHLGLLDGNLVSVAVNHLQKIGLPVSPKAIRKSWDIEALTRHLYKDKKTDGKKLTFILLEEMGKSLIKKDVDEKAFLDVIKSEI